MILGIISDSHDNLHKLKKAISFFNKKNVELVLHAGDYIAPFSVRMLEDNLKCQYLGIFGNNDGERKGLTNISKGKISNDTLELERFNKKILLIHDISQANNDFTNFDIVIHGHTHKVDIQRCNHTWFINPGECGGWLGGQSTIVTLDLVSNTTKVHRL